MRGHTNLSIHELTISGLFAALIGAGAFIKITLPLQPVPMHFTLQWFFVLLAGLLLNKRTAAASVLVYLFLGLAGVPVFASGGGPSYVLKPTFGYLLGFAAAAYVMAWMCEKFQVPGFPKLLLVSMCGLVMYYGIGLAYYFFACRLLAGKQVPWQMLLFNGFFLTAWADLGLCAAAAGAAARLRVTVRRGRL